MAEGATKFRYMHTMIRVLDLDRSIAFYTGLLGMKLLRRDDYPGGKFTNAFVGYGPEDTDTVLELTLNWGREEPYELGTAFGHLALSICTVIGPGRSAHPADESHRDRR